MTGSAALVAELAGVRNAAGTVPLMPVHAMESLIRLGSAAVDEVAAALELAARGSHPDPLYLIVVAGELGDPAFVPALVGFIADPSVELASGVAALEALARIGEPAIEPLVSLAASSPPVVVRIRAYAALGLIPHARAAQALAAAMEHESDAAGALATAVAQHAARGPLGALYLEALYELYRRAPASENTAIEEALRAIAGLHLLPPHPIARNWRTRYRRRPAQNWGIASGWEAQAILARQIREAPGAPALAPSPKRTLEELLADDGEDELPPSSVDFREGPAPRGYCPHCGLREEEIAGIRTCPRLARELLRAQRGLLAGWQSSGTSDLHARLDEIDLAEAEGLRQLAALGADAEGGHEELLRRLDRLAAEQRTLQFLIEEGSGTVAEAIRHVASLLRRAPRASREDLERHGIFKPWRA